MSLRIAALALLAGSVFGQYTAPPDYCVDSGSANAYVCTLTPAVSAYNAGVPFYFKAANANTTASTIAFNGLAAKSIVKVAGGVTTALVANDIRSGQIVELTYDGTNMQMQSTLGNAPQTSGLSLLIASNLSDVANQATALTNILGSSLIPVARGGTVAQGSNACGTSDLCASGNFTSAQIVSITSTGSSWLTVVADPPANTYIRIDEVVIEGTYNGTAYGGGSNMSLYYGTGGGNIAQNTACQTGNFTSAGNRLCASGPVGNQTTSNTNNATGLKLGISSTSYTCASTCGPVYYWVKYHILTGVQ